MKTRLTAFVIFILLLGIMLAGCSKQSPTTSTGTVGQTEQTQQPQTNGNQGGQVQGGGTPATETPPIQNQTPPTPSLPPTPSQPAKTYNVTIKGFAFSPFALKINKGDSVVWTNEDAAHHTITSDSGSELTSGSLSTGQSYSHTFNQAGIFNYHCGIHQTMKARVEVS